MTIAEWYVRRGRLGRTSFWVEYVVPLAVLGLVTGVADSSLGYPPPASEGWSIWTCTGGPVSSLLILAALVPQVSALVARLHDRGHSARWLWWLLVPVAGWLVVWVQTFWLAGDVGPNRYGPTPEQAEPSPTVPQRAS